MRERGFPECGYRSLNQHNTTPPPPLTFQKFFFRSMNRTSPAILPKLRTLGQPENSAPAWVDMRLGEQRSGLEPSSIPHQEASLRKVDTQAFPYMVALNVRAQSLRYYH
jgi:hypothetical protein